MRVKVWNDHGNPVKLLHSGIHTVDGPDVLGRHRFPATGGIHGAVLDVYKRQGSYYPRYLLR